MKRRRKYKQLEKINQKSEKNIMKMEVLTNKQNELMSFIFNLD